MAARRSRTRPACARRAHISLIFAIPTATNCARFIASQPAELSQIITEEGRHFQAVLARERTWLGPIGRAPHERTFGIRRGSALARAGDHPRPPLRLSGSGA